MHERRPVNEEVCFERGGVRPTGMGVVLASCLETPGRARQTEMKIGIG